MRYGLCFPNGGACDDTRTFGGFAHLTEEAGWDGACLYKITNEDMTPSDVRALKEFVERHRAATGPFDIALGGRHRGDDWEQERALIRSLAEAGATWWVEYLPPQSRGFEEMRVRIERGPLRIE